MNIVIIKNKNGYEAVYSSNVESYKFKITDTLTNARAAAEEEALEYLFSQLDLNVLDEELEAHLLDTIEEQVKFFHVGGAF